MLLININSNNTNNITMLTERLVIHSLFFCFCLFFFTFFYSFFHSFFQSTHSLSLVLSKAICLAWIWLEVNSNKLNHLLIHNKTKLRKSELRWSWSQKTNKLLIWSNFSYPLSRFALPSNGQLKYKFKQI